MSKFEDRLKKGILIGDGAMGTLLMQETKASVCPEGMNVTHPDLVLGVHLRYIAAGADIIETNTFAANAPKLRECGLEELMAQINSQAVKLAREAREISGKEVLIAGSIGPLGAFERLALEQELDRRGEYRRQAEILEQRGVELFFIETFSSPEDLRLAVEGVHSISSLPIVAQLTFPGGFRVSDGDGLYEMFASLADLPVAALGVNCGTGPRELLEILEHLPRQGNVVISASPNAGLPVRSGGRYVFPDSTPEYFADFAREAVRLGARIIGGCCGTRPEHIQAMADALRGVALPAQVQTSVSVQPKIAPSPAQVEFPSQLAHKLHEGQFVVSVQLDPPKGAETQRLLEAVTAFKNSGIIDVIDVNSNPLGRLHMDSLWMAQQVERLGMESLPHITPRDASIMGLQGNLLGAHSEGIRNLLVITGDPSMVGGAAGGKDVYQTDSVGLVRLISEMNQGKDAVGNLIGSPTQFYVGVAVNPAAPDLALEVRRFRQKIENGASFAMTQVFFDWAPWDRFLEALGEDSPIPVLAAIWPLTSYRLALRLHHEVPGIYLPETLLHQMEQAGKDARKLGFDLARKMISEAKTKTQGIYIIAPFKDAAAALELLT
ncbi:MAG: bifunctional homocysteine S-methyltransferase/methylenetetrahydrofolate reductase [Terriglobia bacterium]